MTAAMVLITDVAVSEPAEAPLKMPNPDTEEVECLALNIYFEARSETIEGQIAVAQVTLNRVNSDHFPDTVCDVVWQKRPTPQFSWTQDGKSDEPKNSSAYEIAEAIALVSMMTDGILPNVVDDSLFYHADYADDNWFSNNLEVVTVVGDHIFYRIPSL